ncbi:hypothetical protein DENSPDRAFT_624211 [Dentipellis sp. KUC8613]|nr:hypothetical protein DENSPDRAFT_624211 [Dentipellis sp. KUC8613]
MPLVDAKHHTPHTTHHDPHTTDWVACESLGHDQCAGPVACSLHRVSHSYDAQDAGVLASRSVRVRSCGWVLGFGAVYFRRYVCICVCSIPPHTVTIARDSPSPSCRACSAAPAVTGAALHSGAGLPWPEKTHLIRLLYPGPLPLPRPSICILSYFYTSLHGCNAALSCLVLGHAQCAPTCCLCYVRLTRLLWLAAQLSYPPTSPVGAAVPLRPCGLGLFLRKAPPMTTASHIPNPQTWLALSLAMAGPPRATGVRCFKHLLLSGLSWHHRPSAIPTTTPPNYAASVASRVCRRPSTLACLSARGRGSNPTQNARHSAPASSTGITRADGRRHRTLLRARPPHVVLGNQARRARRALGGRVGL